MATGTRENDTQSTGRVEQVKTEQVKKQTIQIRRANERGGFDHGWLKTAHSFSFGQYHDPDWMGFGTLRVINEDLIEPHMGFGEHPHRDMEIITYPVSGAVRHRDSLGHEEDIVPGMIQHMSAGSGIRHSEFNPLGQTTHLLQIWIEPREMGVEPGHQSRGFPIHEEQGQLHLLASPDGAQGSMMIQQDAWVSAGVFEQGASIELSSKRASKVWIQVIHGRLSVEGYEAHAGDGIAINGFDSIELSFDKSSEIMVFELA